MTINKSPCFDVMNHICDNLGEDINSPKCIAFKEHLKGCSSCRQYFNSVKTTISLFADEKVELSDAAHEELLKFLKLDS